MFNEAFIPGATAVGITFKEGVVLGAEKRIAYGRFIVSSSGKKVFTITDTVGAAFAGMIGDMQILVREMTSYVKLREMEIRRNMSPQSVAKLMSVLLFERRFAPFITQTILGGIDNKPYIYVLDPLGSVIPDDYACVGSGAETALGVIDSDFKNNMNEEQSKELVASSIRSACKRDAASGNGIDLLILTSKGSKIESMSL